MVRLRRRGTRRLVRRIIWLIAPQLMIFILVIGLIGALVSGFSGMGDADADDNACVVDPAEGPDEVLIFGDQLARGVAKQVEDRSDKPSTDATFGRLDARAAMNRFEPYSTREKTPHNVVISLGTWVSPKNAKAYVETVESILFWAGARNVIWLAPATSKAKPLRVALRRWKTSTPDVQFNLIDLAALRQREGDWFERAGQGLTAEGREGVAENIYGLITEGTGPDPEDAPTTTDADMSPYEITMDQNKTDWTDSQIDIAKTIISVGQKKGLPARAMVIALATAMQESTLTNILEPNWHGNSGVFQQMPPTWGNRDQINDPAHAAGAFYAALTKVPRWQTKQLWEVAADVQAPEQSAETYYGRWETDAIRLVKAYYGDETIACGGDAPVSDCDFPGFLNQASCKEAIEWADNIANGPDRCWNEIKGQSWDNWCANFVAQAYGYSQSGSASAIEQWNSLEALHIAHEGDSDPPVGSLVFWDVGTYGHVALYAGDGKAYSNDFIEQGCIDLTPMDKISSSSVEYLGWAPPAFAIGGFGNDS